jgi:cytochrome c553
MRSLALVAILAACTPTASGSDDPPETGRVKYHMRQRFSDLRTIERMLVAGKLEDAQALAYMLTRPVASVPQSREVNLATDALVNARTLAQAIHAEVRVATACAHCHLATQNVPVFPTPPQAPPDRPDIAAQMARHQWAVDRLWEGVVGASEEHWRAGLYVIATSSLGAISDRKDLATRLQRIAREALDQPTATLDARADTYAKLLLTCAGCHAQSVTPPPP